MRPLKLQKFIIRYLFTLLLSVKMLSNKAKQHMNISQARTYKIHYTDMFVKNLFVNIRTQLTFSFKIFFRSFGGHQHTSDVHQEGRENSAQQFFKAVPRKLQS